MNPGKNDTRAKWTRDKNLPGQKSHPGKMDPGIIARAKITRAEIARETVAAPALTANSQGVNGEIGVQNLKLKLGNSTWSEFCKRTNNL